MPDFTELVDVSYVSRYPAIFHVGTGNGMSFSGTNGKWGVCEFPFIRSATTEPSCCETIFPRSPSDGVGIFGTFRKLHPIGYRRAEALKFGLGPNIDISLIYDRY
jgi:hypothetical protein